MLGVRVPGNLERHGAYHNAQNTIGGSNISRSHSNEGVPKIPAALCSNTAKSCRDQYHVPEGRQVGLYLRRLRSQSLGEWENRLQIR